MKNYQDIVKKYPRLFKIYNSQMPFAMFGFECGPGWYDLIECLCHNINDYIQWRRESRARFILYNRALKRAQNGDLRGLQHYYRDYKPESQQRNIERDIEDPRPRPVVERVDYIHIDQIKEKFGGLRFYYSGGDDEIAGMVRMAESMSYRLCEVCGSPGRPNKEGWIQTLCKEHEKD